ncbi:Ganglioside GM2 activator [Trichuris trichiura]|uniref:Ganglioside GM2 activator n=1 Tax=Trichuris trichiura TaxID=36087 RepID=A0A077ZBC2_TRITR|nr:Ganglioside GM2 activator [Trichuris trichiura]
MLAYVCLVAVTLVGILVTDNAAAEGNDTPKWDSVYVDCGDHDRFVVVKNVTFSQMPVVLPGKSQISVHLNLTNDIPDDLDVDMLMETLSANGQWSRVPCMFNSVGSCSLRGISACSFTYGLLGCPITKGNYEITEDLLLPYLSDRMLAAIVGEYRVSVKIRESGAAEIACINLQFGIQKGPRNPHYYYEE